MKLSRAIPLDYNGSCDFDARLVCKNGAIQCHRLVLAAGSKFMKKILEDLEVDELVDILLPDFDILDLNQVVNIIYGVSCDIIPDAFGVLQFDQFEKYQISEVKLEFEPVEVLEPMTELLLPQEEEEEETLYSLQSRDKNEELLSWDDDIKKENKPEGKKTKKIRKKTKKLKPAKQGVEPKYSCDHCDFGTMNTSSIKRHYANRHPDKETPKIGKREKKEPIQVKCTECEYTSNHQRNIDLHYARIHGTETFPCMDPSCSFTFKTKYALTFHTKIYHSGNMYQCDQCPYKSKFNNCFKIHHQKMHEGVKYICDRCGYQGPNPKLLEDHIKTVHDGFRFKCEHCSFSDPTYRTVWKHKVSSHNIQLHLCDVCSYSTPMLHMLKQHKRRVHVEPKLKCDYCDFLSKTVYNLKRHISNKHKHLELLSNAEHKVEVDPLGENSNS